MNRQTVIGVRVSDSERQALRTLARREDRTESGWLRARLLEQAGKAGLIVDVDQLGVHHEHQVAQAA